MYLFIRINSFFLAEMEGKSAKVKTEPKTFVKHPLTTAILEKNRPSFLDAMPEHLESLENIAVFFPNDGKENRCIIIIFHGGGST